MIFLTNSMKQDGALIENLEDSGCSKKFINSYLSLKESEKTEEQMLNLLSKHREKLLQSIHEFQIKIDCLDYLIHKVKNETP